MTHITQLTLRESTFGPRIMAMTLVVFGIMVMHSLPVQAQQWTTNGSNINNTNAGNVGVGTSGPGDPLHVSKSQNAGTIVRVDNPDASGNSAYSGIRFYQGGTMRGQLTSINDGFTAGVGGVGALQLWNPLNANLIFGTNGTERVRIQGNGYVGIGTTAPSSLLHLRSASHTYLQVGAPLGFQSSISFNDDTNGQDIVLYRPENSRDFSVWTAASSRVLTVTQSGNVGIGTTAPAARLDVVGNLNASGTITGGNIVAKYQDVAEWVQSSQVLQAGTVVVLDQTKSNQVIASSQAYDTRVAGVISSQPGITLGEKGAGKVLVATTGRVRIKVDASRAAIQVGDLLVTSDVAGVAMKSLPIDLGGVQIHRPGTLIGKALEPIDKGTGEILVLLSLQ